MFLILILNYIVIFATFEIHIVVELNQSEIEFLWAYYLHFIFSLIYLILRRYILIIQTQILIRLRKILLYNGQTSKGEWQHV